MRTLSLLDSNFIDLERVIYYYLGARIYREGDPQNGFKKELIHDEYDYIKERYEEYDNNILRLEDIERSQILKTWKCSVFKNLYCELYELYDSKDELKTKIRDRSESRCPYCGTIDNPFNVDHILPRSKYPEFSMFNHNLIGVCSSCNTRYKGDDFILGGERQFFNPYIDTFIDDNQFLICCLSVNDIYLKIDFSIEDIDNEAYGYMIIKNHFDNLHLKSRYKQILLQDELKKFKDIYIDENTQEYEDVTLDELKRDITKEIRKFKSFNKNHWEKVFWKALKECDEYLNLIVDKRIPID